MSLLSRITRALSRIWDVFYTGVTVTFTFAVVVGVLMCLGDGVLDAVTPDSPLRTPPPSLPCLITDGRAEVTFPAGIVGSCYAAQVHFYDESGKGTDDCWDDLSTKEQPEQEYVAINGSRLKVATRSYPGSSPGRSVYLLNTNEDRHGYFNPRDGSPRGHHVRQEDEWCSVVDWETQWFSPLGVTKNNPTGLLGISSDTDVRAYMFHLRQINPSTSGWALKMQTRAPAVAVTCHAFCYGT